MNPTTDKQKTKNIQEKKMSERDPGQASPPDQQPTVELTDALQSAREAEMLQDGLPSTIQAGNSEIVSHQTDYSRREGVRVPGLDEPGTAEITRGSVLTSEKVPRDGGTVKYQEKDYTNYSVMKANGEPQDALTRVSDSKGVDVVRKGDDGEIQYRGKLTGEKADRARDILHRRAAQNVTKTVIENTQEQPPRAA